MATVEEKVDVILKQVKEIQVEQIKHYSKLEHVTMWSDKAERTAGEIQYTIKDLTSRITTLEALTSTAFNEVPLREEEGRAHSHSVPPNQ
jgi:hypothetical protein